VLFIIDKGFYYFLDKAPKLEYDQRLEKVINGKINKDLIVLGSSRGAGNIIASQIQKETKLSSYNLSYPGSNVVFHEFILKSLLQYNQKPKTIIFSIDNPYEFMEEKSLSFRFDRLYPLSKYNYINQELVNREERNILSWAFCLGRLNKASFSFKPVQAPLENPILSCGSMPFIKKLPTPKMEFFDNIEVYDMNKELPEKVLAFKNIQAICKEKNIQLIFVFSPNYRKFNTNFEKRFRKLMMPENKILVYNTSNPIYKDEAYYFDVSHLMKNAATVFTTEISTFINQDKN
jgi:hypothetical protein